MTSSSPVRLLVASAGTLSTELLRFAPAGIGDQEGPVVSEEDLLDLLLLGLVNKLLVVGKKGLGKGLGKEMNFFFSLQSRKEQIKSIARDGME